MNKTSTLRKNLMGFLAFGIIVISSLAAYYPLFFGLSDDVHPEYLMFGFVGAFMIFLIANFMMHTKCPSCGKYIPEKSKICPYCEKKL